MATIESLDKGEWDIVGIPDANGTVHEAVVVRIDDFRNVPAQGVMEPGHIYVFPPRPCQNIRTCVYNTHSNTIRDTVDARQDELVVEVLPLGFPHFQTVDSRV